MNKIICKLLQVTENERAVRVWTPNTCAVDVLISCRYNICVGSLVLFRVTFLGFRVKTCGEN